jgi:predicted transcriptional regulator YdeE
MPEPENEFIAIEKELKPTNNIFPRLEIDEMKIVGVKIRTSNKGGQSLKDQPALWKNFFSEGLAEKISNKLHPEDILGIYFNYESDYTGYYDFLIGFEVAGFENISEKFVKLNIPLGLYSVFTDHQKMNLGDKVYTLWQRIWNSGLNRAYNFDIEEYNLEKMFSDNPDVKIYIGIKSDHKI